MFRRFSVTRDLKHVTLPLVLCMVAAFAQLHLLQMASGLETALRFTMAAAWAGKDWSGYRSRLLGVGSIHMLGGDMRAFLIVTFASLVLGGALSWYLDGARGFGIYHAGFALVANPWFAPWDIWGPVLFTLFVIFVIERRTTWWFVALFAVAIFDRQSAMFIPLWMILSRRFVRAGVVCAAAGIAIMWFWQHSGLPHFGFWVFGSGYGTDYGQERILENLHHLIEPLVAGIFVVVILAAVVVMREEMTLGLTFLALLLTTSVLGILSETRVYLDFLPLLVLAARGTAVSRRTELERRTATKQADAA